MKSIAFRAIKNGGNGYVRSAFVGNAETGNQSSRGMGIALGLLAIAIAVTCLILLSK